MEVLVVVAVMMIMVGLVVGSAGAISGTQGMTAVQQVTALCDQARARSLRGDGMVMLAFATETDGLTGEPYRSAILCAEDFSTEDPNDYVPISEWYYLPQGYVFSSVDPATSGAGLNALTAAGGRRTVTLPGKKMPVELPCIGFGSLGEVVFPPADTATEESLLIAIAEGDVGGDGPRTRQGGAHRPEDCRWLALRRNSGSPMILP